MRIRLYNSETVSQKIESIVNSIIIDVSSYTQDELEDVSLVDKIVSQRKIDIPSIHIENITCSTVQKELPAEVFPVTYNVYPGNRYKCDVLIFHVEYSGDIQLLKLKPNPYAILQTPEFDIDTEAKCFNIEVVNFDNDQERIRAKLEDGKKALANRNYLQIHKVFTEFNDKLHATVVDIIEKRKANLIQTNELLGSLGVTPKKVSSIDTTGHVQKKPTKSKDGVKYDVAISFAGEDREIAEKIFKKLTELGYEVFYDKDEEASLWGKNLYTYLNDIYSNKARYCLMIISKHYATKRWTNHEREAAQAKAFKQNEEYILPLRLDETTIPGLNTTVGYVSYSMTGFEETIKLLVSKIGLKNRS